MTINYVVPSWDAPSHIQAYTTTRLGGYSESPFHSLNYSYSVGDNPQHVAANRQHIKELLQLPNDPIPIKLVHGNHVLKADSTSTTLLEADGVYTNQPNIVCSVTTADCLPVLLCDKQGTQVAAVHAGWRGLAAEIIANAVNHFSGPRADILAWLGPAIGPQSFEVGPEVREQFLAINSNAVTAFQPSASDRWLANIYQLARQQLQALGITAIYGGNYCTYSEPNKFYSYRRDKITGRMINLIWLASRNEID